jgi:kynureninase
VSRWADEAAQLDLDDPLARWRDEFVIPDPDLAYLDGNSLGMPPKRAIDEVTRVMTEEWAGGLIGSWDHWLDLPMTVGDELAPLLGAPAGTVVIHDSVTVDLHQLVHVALALRPERRAIVVPSDDFPTVRYVVDGIAGATGHDVRHAVEDLDDVAVVVRSLVDYRTAETLDLAAETARYHDAGALVVWDLSHAAGVLDLDLTDAEVDLAVGCTYKFLNGGPGAPAFSFVSEHLIGEVDPPLRGWFGARDQFEMSDRYEPRPDVGRLLLGTPGILGLTAARVGIGITADAGIGAIADKARRLTGLALEMCDDLGLTSTTPHDPARRGAHVAVVHPEAKALTDALARDHGVIADFRTPDVVRLGCSPLTTRFTDVARALTTLARL